jgi:hypothetical protein
VPFGAAYRQNSVRIAVRSKGCVFLPVAVNGDGGPEHPDSGFKGGRSPALERLETVHQTEEDFLPGVPGHQVIDDLATRSHNLRQDVDEGTTVGRKIDPQQAVLLGISSFFCPSCERYRG